MFWMEADMASQSALGKSAGRERAMMSHSPSGRGGAWERHVIIALWVSIAALMALVAALWYAQYQGLFAPSPDHTAPSASWPISWP